MMQYGERPGLSEPVIAYVLGEVLQALHYMHSRALVHKCVLSCLLLCAAGRLCPMQLSV